MYLKKHRIYEGILILFMRILHMIIYFPVTDRNHAILKTENVMGKFVQEQLILEKTSLRNTS